MHQGYSTLYPSGGQPGNFFPQTGWGAPPGNGFPTQPAMNAPLYAPISPLDVQTGAIQVLMQGHIAPLVAQIADQQKRIEALQNEVAVLRLQNDRSSNLRVYEHANHNVPTPAPNTTAITPEHTGTVIAAIKLLSLHAKRRLPFCPARPLDE